MTPRHPATALAAVAGWLLLTTGHAAVAAAPAVDLGGAALPEGVGSASRADPTVLDPGVWADTLGDSQTPQADHYFRYDRRMRFSTVHVGVIGASGDPDGDGLSIEINGPEETPCDSGTAQPGWVDSATFGVRAWAGGSEPGVLDEECAVADELEIVVSRTSGDDELPIAIKVVEEAPVTGAEELPPPEPSPSFRPGAPPAEGERLAGATGFDDAPTVPLSGGAATFSTEVTEGEQRLFRIPLTWGQEVSVEALLAEIDATVEEERSYDTPDVEVVLVDPLREPVDTAVDGLTSYDSTSSEDAPRLSAALPPLGYRNRYESDAGVVPGDHWLSIAVSGPVEDLEPLAVEVDVEVEVGDTDEAEPVYQGTVQSPDGGAGPADYVPGTPYLIGPDEFSAVASGTPVLPDGEGGWWGPRRYAGLGLAVASLVCCGLGARRLVR